MAALKHAMVAAYVINVPRVSDHPAESIWN